MYARLLTLTIEISELGKDLSPKETNLKVLRGLPSPWKMKVTAMRDSKDLRTYSTEKLISDLKSYEFEMSEEEKEEVEDRTTTALTASTSQVNNFYPSTLLTDEYMAVFARKFRKFMKPKDGRSPSSSRKPHQKTKSSESSGELLCYNCRQPGQFKANCPHPIFSKRQGQEGEKKYEHRRRKALITEQPEKDPLSETESSSESESDETFCCLDTETEDLCLMGQSDDEVSSTSASSFASVGKAFDSESMSEFWEEFQAIQTTYSSVKEENSKLKVEIVDLRKKVETKINLLNKERDQLEAENVSLLKRVRKIESIEIKYNTYQKAQYSMERLLLGQQIGIGFGLSYVSTE
ncbi:unnamed protein product [Cuscuta europaea]|uniref:CCHC-type domain-containing protein n=1 Tax=Cuscuta europaea TaxID=41803 RepID=A0A9P0ZU89_CUSEU|nr:unnamed protein product [Cuscuta europaea]